MKPNNISPSPIYNNVLYIIPILSYFIPLVKTWYTNAPSPTANIMESPVGLSTNTMLNNSINSTLACMLSLGQCKLYISLILCPKNTYIFYRLVPKFCNPLCLRLPTLNITLLYFFAYHDTTKSVLFSISFGFICMPFVIGDNMLISPISQ